MDIDPDVRQRYRGLVDSLREGMCHEMFFRRRRHSGFLVRMLLILLGLRWLSHKSGHDCDETVRKERRLRAKVFRRKLREAFAVWDDEAAVEEHDATHTPAE